MLGFILQMRRTLDPVLEVVRNGAGYRICYGLQPVPQQAIHKAQTLGLTVEHKLHADTMARAARIMRAMVGNAANTFQLFTVILPNAHGVPCAVLDGDTANACNLQVVASLWRAPTLARLQPGRYHSPALAATQAWGAPQQPVAFA